MRYLLLAVLLMPAFGRSQQPTSCKIRFSVVQKDQLNNILQGVKPETEKWFKEKMAKKYPDVCFAKPDPSVPLVFFVRTTVGTHQGKRTVTDTNPVEGTITDENGNTSTVQGTQTSRRQVDNTFDYPIFTLSVETETAPGKGDWKVIHNFQKHGICEALYGIRIKCHPQHDVLEAAIKWLHDGGLTDPMQTNLQAIQDATK